MVYEVISVKKDKVSIIVPVYNVEHYLRECLISLASQDYCNYEVILIDDGSTDSSLSICNEYKKKYKNFKVLSQNNLGVSEARNKGLKNATGEWICFVDSDDYVECNMISSLMKLVSKKKYDIVITSPILEFDSKSLKSKIFDSHIVFNKKNKKALITNIICRQYNNIFHSNISAGGPWAKLYRRKFLVDNGLTFEFGLKRMQDVIFNIHAVTSSQCILYENLFLYHYRINQGSSTVKYNPDIFTIFSKVLSLMYEFAEQENTLEYFEAIYLKTVLLFIEGARISIVNSQNSKNFFGRIHQLKYAYNLPLFKKAFHKVSQKIDFKLRVFVIFANFHLYYIVYFLIYVFSKLKYKEQQ